MQVYIQDARALGYCSRGMREMCEQKGLSWENFLKNGIDAEELRKLDDSMANKLIEQAEKRNAG